jgi:hypothetical protein
VVVEIGCGKPVGASFDGEDVLGCCAVGCCDCLDAEGCLKAESKESDNEHEDENDDTQSNLFPPSLTYPRVFVETERWKAASQNSRGNNPRVNFRAIFSTTRSFILGLILLSSIQ